MNTRARVTSNRLFVLAHKMNCCGGKASEGDEEARKESKVIDKEIKQEKKEADKKVKLLLLGINFIVAILIRF